MEYDKLREALIRKLSVKRQAVWARANRMREKYGPMSLEEATALVAHDEELDVSQYMDPPELQRIRDLINHRAIMQSPDLQRRAKLPAPRTVKVTIAGEFSLTDPVLPTAILDDAKQMTKVYAELYVFENSVREVILRAMSKAHGEGWWERGAPAKVRKNVADRMSNEKKNPWHGKRGAHQIYYTNITDLPLIIRRNWSVFEDLFPSQMWVFQKIEEIAQSRNVVDHHNPLNRRDQDRIRVYFKDWIDQVQSVKEQLV